MSFLRPFLHRTSARITRGRLVFAALFILLGMLSTLLPTGEKKVDASATPQTQVVTVSQDTQASRATTETTVPEIPLAGSLDAQRDGKWGEAVAFDDFSASSLNTGEGGWQIYNKPKGKPIRHGENVSVKDGLLQLGGTYENGVNAGSGVSQAFDQMYGRWEIRARADKGAGFSPTILLWPQSEKWPVDGEIDLLETPRGDRTKAVAVIHNGVRNLNPSHGLEGDHSEWHTYAVDWLPESVTFYIDGKQQWNVTNPLHIPKTSPMHLAIQMDAGCGWVQCPNAQTPAVTNFQVDWVKVYKAP